MTHSWGAPAFHQGVATWRCAACGVSCTRPHASVWAGPWSDLPCGNRAELERLERVVEAQRVRAAAWRRAADEVARGEGPDAGMATPAFVASRERQACLEAESLELLERYAAELRARPRA